MNPWLAATTTQAAPLGPNEAASFALTYQHVQRQVGGGFRGQVSKQACGSLCRLLAQAPVLAGLLLLVTFAPPALGQSAVTLAWDPSPGSGIAGYLLYEGTASRSYSDVIDVGESTTATASNLVSGTTYYFAVTAYDTNGLESDFSSEIIYTVLLPTSTPPANSQMFAADSGTFTDPFVASKGTLSQSVTTDVTNDGRTIYSFNIDKAGSYLVSALVVAPSLSQNSFYVNMDAEPTDPVMIWDIPVCSVLTSRTVSWRGNGNGDPASAQYIPKVFTLSAGTHELFIYGREANTTLGTITIAPAPPVLQIKMVAGMTSSLSAIVPPSRMSAVLSVAGLAGQTCNILRSLDFMSWSIIGTLTLDDSGSGQFTDPGSTSRPISFYRVQAISDTPPKLQIRASAGGAFVLSGTGPAGRMYNVQCTQDFEVWTVIGSVTLDIGGSFTFTDPAGTSRPKCFYRLQGQ